jgi:hypothetical protein
MYSSAANAAAHVRHLQPGDVIVARPRACLEPDRRARNPIDQTIEVDLVRDDRARPVGDVEIVEKAARQDRADLLEVLRLVEQRAADDGVAHQDRRGERDRGEPIPFDALDDATRRAAGVGIDHAQKLGDAVAVIVGADIGHNQPERPLAVAEVAALAGNP